MTRFLSNRALWDEIRRRSSDARHTRAAIAYLGTGGARPLHLKRGDTLVVDMSIAVVKQGATNPTEVKKLIRRGVKVYSRPNLHAKIVVFDNAVIASSANASLLSQRRLEEAGCITTDRIAVARAREFIDSISIDLVRTSYLNKCIALYRTPRFAAAREGSETTGGTGQRRSRPADLWFVSGLERKDLPEDELGKVAAAEKRAARHKRKASARIDYIHYDHKPKWLDLLRLGDLIVCTVEDQPGRWEVSPPERFLAIESHPRGFGQRRYLVMVEHPSGSEAIRFGQFRSRLGRREPFLSSRPPRTRGIRDAALADRIRRIWTESGRVSRITRGLQGS